MLTKSREDLYSVILVFVNIEQSARARANIHTLSDKLGMAKSNIYPAQTGWKRNYELYRRSQ